MHSISDEHHIRHIDFDIFIDADYSGKAKETLEDFKIKKESEIDQ